MEGALQGIRVVALEQAAAAPFCTRQLADLGAEVIKIERPGEGDLARGYDGALSGLSAYFAWLNRGKRSLALDLKSEPGKQALERLLQQTDIFVHNLLPGAVERLGYGWEELHQRFPQLIWVSISGYGPGGPYSQKKAYDMLIQAEAGVVSLTGTAQEAVKVGISIADVASGLYAYSSTLAALIKRGRTGQGDRIEISMLEALAEWTMPPLYTYLGQGKQLERAGFRHNMIVPYGAYRCADGQVVFAIQNEREWRNFCGIVLQQPDLATQPDYARNQDRLAHRIPLEALIETVLGKLSQQQVLARLEEAQIANAALNDMAALAAHPQLQARHRWTQVDSPVGPIPALLPPHNLASQPPQMGAVPALGQHTEEILRSLGLWPNQEV